MESPQKKKEKKKKTDYRKEKNKTNAPFTLTSIPYSYRNSSQS